MLHYTLTNALVWASEDFKRLNKWADQYNANINTKYGQVCSVPTLQRVLGLIVRG